MIKSFHVGDTAKMLDLAVTVNSAHFSSGDEIHKPAQGEQFLAIDCTIENQSTELIDISSTIQFSLIDQDYYSRETALMRTKGDLSVELGPGRKTRGELAFAVDEGQQEFELIIQPYEIGIGQVIFKITKYDIK